jgi:hypothetical protein
MNRSCKELGRWTVGGFIRSKGPSRGGHHCIRILFALGSQFIAGAKTEIEVLVQRCQKLNEVYIISYTR